MKDKTTVAILSSSGCDSGVPSRPGNVRLFRTSDGVDYTVPFVLIASLFFLWGFCHGLMDILDNHFQETLHIAKAQSAMVQFSGYIGYALMAMPAGWIARRYGYKGGILAGLSIICAGALWFVPATQINAFPAFLGGLFIVFAGLTCLETVANPYTTVLGPAETAAARINFAQSCNSVGWIFGPLVGSSFLDTKGAGGRLDNSQLYIPYLGIACVVALLFVIFKAVKMPEVKAPDEYHDDEGEGGRPSTALWSHRHFSGAFAAQFLYVAAQTGIFSFFINYMRTEPPGMAAAQARLLPEHWTVATGDVYMISKAGAAYLLSLGGFVLFFAGRFVGGLLLRRVQAHRLLGIYGAVCAVLMAIILAHAGWISAGSVVLSFFFMSIMFPTIFALGLHGLGPLTKRASSFIVMAIVGGAVMPMAMGHIADLYSMTAGFVVPLFCFGGIAVYGFLWRKLSGAKGMHRLPSAIH
jgi:FHS family L-fucose permease-like MFS transporter